MDPDSTDGAAFSPQGRACRRCRLGDPPDACPLEAGSSLPGGTCGLAAGIAAMQLAWRFLSLGLIMLSWILGCSSGFHSVAFPCFSPYLFWLVLFWILYIAIEPFVRRRWPQILVSWTRLLSGNGGIHSSHATLSWAARLEC